jgi:hypothetical protein
MDGLKRIMDLQLSEKEVMVYMLVQSGMTYRDLGERLGMSHQAIANIYKSGEKKLIFLAENNLLQTQL